jgi:hypothetical protein
VSGTVSNRATISEFEKKVAAIRDGA